MRQFDATRGNASIAVLVNPDNPNADLDVTELQNAARTLGQSITFVRARSEAEIDAVFATLGEWRVSALLVNTDPFFLALISFVRIALDHFQNLVPVQIRHHQIEQDQAEFFLLDQRKRLVSAGRAGNPLVTIGGEHQLERISIVLIVIDDKDTGEIR